MLKNNILLANFLGLETMHNNLMFDYEVNEYININDLNYNESWDMLMLVVTKIESLGYYTNSDMDFTGNNNQIVMHFFRIYKGGYQGVNIAFGKHHNKIEAVYNACVEFIEWWNKNKS